MLEGIWIQGNTLPLLVGVQTGTVFLEFSTVIYQKIGNQYTSRPSNITLGLLPKGNSFISQKHLLNIHSSIIHNSQNLEITWMPLN